MYLGRFQLGATVPLYLECTDGGTAPTLPDSPPQYKAFLNTTVVEQHLMPIQDRYVVTGLFRSTLFLGRLYSVGMYSVVYYYSISGVAYMQTDNFEVVAGGDSAGAVVSTYFFARPEANYIVQSTEQSVVKRGRNPTV